MDARGPISTLPRPSLRILTPSLSRQEKAELYEFPKLQYQFLRIMDDVPKLLKFVELLEQGPRTALINGLIEVSTACLAVSQPVGAPARLPDSTLTLSEPVPGTFAKPGVPITPPLSPVSVSSFRTLDAAESKPQPGTGVFGDSSVRVPKFKTLGPTPVQTASSPEEYVEVSDGNGGSIFVPRSQAATYSRSAFRMERPGEDSKDPLGRAWS